MNHQIGLASRLLGGLVCAIGCVALSYGAAQPNIILILSDDAGYNDFGFSAALNGRTPPGDSPNLDALAAQSVALRQGYVAAPLCSTSRAGLLTGQYGQRFGFEYNLASGLNAVQDSGTNGLSAQQVTIAQHLKGLGYSTGTVGKWHLGYADGFNRPLDKGFDEFFGFFGGGSSILCVRGRASVVTAREHDRGAAVAHRG